MIPGRSSLGVGLVKPIPAELARPLIDSLVNEVVVHDHAIAAVVPHDPIGCRAAIELALRLLLPLGLAIEALQLALLLLEEALFLVRLVRPRIAHLLPLLVQVFLELVALGL